MNKYKYATEIYPWLLNFFNSRVKIIRLKTNTISVEHTFELDVSGEVYSRLYVTYSWNVDVGVESRFFFIKRHGYSGKLLLTHSFII